MIVVLGVPCAARDDEGAIVAGSRAVAIADAAVLAGAAVEIAGRIGDDADGDGVVLDLGRRGIGHAALLRVGGLVTPRDAVGSGARPSAADIDLALRYLPGYRVVVAAGDIDPDGLRAAGEAASWADARLVVITDADRSIPDLPDGTTVLAAPKGDGGGAFDALVGAYVAALDRGEEPSRAFADQVAAFRSESVR